MTSTLPPLVQAVSGALGSASANALVYPLDLITTRVQLASAPSSRLPQPASSSSKSSKDKAAVHPALPILRRVLNKYGWAALYDGVFTDTGATLLSKYVLHALRYVMRVYPPDVITLCAASSTSTSTRSFAGNTAPFLCVEMKPS